jgi:protein TonB
VIACQLTPIYTASAIQHEVEGTAEVRCIVSFDGLVHDCRVLRGLPFMDGEVIETLERRRYQPATCAGRALEVEYTFYIDLRLPGREARFQSR